MSKEDFKLEKPMPEATPLTKPFWDGLAERKIKIQYSPSTDAWVFYPRELAPGSLADDLEWREISGKGTLYTYTIATRPVAPMFADDLPQCLAVVEFEEGPRVSTEIVVDDFSKLEVGMRVRPVFHDYPDYDITMLRFEPDVE